MNLILTTGKYRLLNLEKLPC